jgi:phospholipid/cholesterol/gamma-HCH transport system substrate-binding protein
MPDQAKNMLIGIFVVSACAIVIFVLMFLHPSVGDEGRILRIRFANIDKISLGTRVTFAGKPVGEVVGITELPDADTERKPINGRVYVYELTLRVDSGVNVFNTDEVSARTSGLLGEKSVAITPGAPQPGEELRRVNNEVIYANESGSVEETLKNFKDLSDKVEIALDSFIDAMTTMKDNKFWENLSKTAENTSSITASLNNKKQWSETLANVHKLSGKANKTWDKLDVFVSDIDKAALSANTAIENANLVIENVHKGEGTIGRLLVKDDIYLKTNSLLSKAEVTLNDVNHYGVLFHLDKGWQRLRARRLNLMQKLSTPQEFRNYFNDEVDSINTSLSRVAMIMEQVDTQSGPGCYDFLQNNEFSKVYRELLRRVATLEEEIRMFNQQVVDNSVYETELIDCSEYQ